MTLTPEKIQEIETQTLDILDEAYEGLNKIIPPIILEEVLEALDLNLQIGEFSDAAVSGRYERAKNCIYVADSEPYARRRFTIAHEIGHHIMHLNDEEVFYRNDSLRINQITDEMEAEANWFAASLLMPKYLVTQLWPILKSKRLMAESFMVSNLTAFYRLNNLGLLELKK